MVKIDNEFIHYEITLTKLEELQKSKTLLTVRRQALERRVRVKKALVDSQRVQSSVTEGQIANLKLYS